VYVYQRVAFQGTEHPSNQRFIDISDARRRRDALVIHGHGVGGHGGGDRAGAVERHGLDGKSAGFCHGKTGRFFRRFFRNLVT